MNDEFHDLQDRGRLAWSKWAANDVVDELLTGKLLSHEQVPLAEEIVAQQLHVLPASGSGPDHPRFSS